MALPAEYTYGYVVARIVQSVGDGPDSDREPDMIAAGGKITFRPKRRNRKTTYDYSALVLNQDVVCDLFVPPPGSVTPTYPPGTMLDPQGNQGVWLPTGNYTVDFALERGTYPSVDITVTEEHTSVYPLDLIQETPPIPPEKALMVLTEVPPGGRPNQTLVWDEAGGNLEWRDVVPNITVGSTPPPEPLVGDLWFNTGGQQ